MNTMQENKKTISYFGEYKGYSKQKFNTWNRKSNYVTVSDGTKLAIDIFFPAKNNNNKVISVCPKKDKM